MKTSSYSGFFKLSTEDRMKEVAEFCGLSEAEQAILQNADSLDMDKADHMIENVIGRFTLPMGVGINFVINGKDYVIPMVTEEPSVVAACSNAAKMARPGGGTTVEEEAQALATLDPKVIAEMEDLELYALLALIPEGSPNYKPEYKEKAARAAEGSGQA